jgi:hypothetical protein
MTSKGTPDQIAERYIAVCAERDELENEAKRLRALLLEIEGAFLGYWTDMPDEAVENFRVRIREVLGTYR